MCFKLHYLHGSLRIAIWLSPPPVTWMIIVDLGGESMPPIDLPPFENHYSMPTVSKHIATTTLHSLSSWIVTVTSFPGLLSVFSRPYWLSELCSPTVSSRMSSRLKCRDWWTASAHALQAWHACDSTAWMGKPGCSWTTLRTLLEPLCSCSQTSGCMRITWWYWEKLYSRPYPWKWSSGDLELS